MNLRPITHTGEDGFYTSYVALTMVAVPSTLIYLPSLTMSVELEARKRVSRMPEGYSAPYMGTVEPWSWSFRRVGELYLSTCTRRIGGQRREREGSYIK
jgi:hypothetical protein